MRRHERRVCTEGRRCASCFPSSVHLQSPARLLACAVPALLLVLLAGSSGCQGGFAEQSETFTTGARGSVSSIVEMKAGGVGESSGELEGGWGPPAPEICNAFEALRERIRGLALYKPSELPIGTSLAPYWWPVSSGSQQEEWSKQRIPNPYVSSRDEPAEVRVALMVGDAWLEVIEGVQGDLGDLPGEPAGRVGSSEAKSYHLLGGELVQWGHQGSWYAVFGRGLERADVERVARGMAMLGG